MIVLKHASERIVQAISRIALLGWGQHGVDLDARWHAYDYDELVARDKTNLNTSWLRDVSVDDAASLVDPDVIAAEAIEDLQTALDEITLITPTSPAHRLSGAVVAPALCRPVVCEA